MPPSDPKTYYAFISYSHKDENWAKWLQHKIEHYKLPTNLNGHPDLPRSIRPVFRDMSELTPGNLPRQIQDALAASRYLIVVCSPHAAQSEWVDLEVATFKRMGKQDCIIPFIVDGRPFADNPAEECFLPEIRNLPKDQELLGVNIAEMGREAAVVKTVARMFGIRFDILWKRFEREQKRRRNWIIAAVALVLLVVLGVAAYIWNQNSIIKKSRDELQKSKDELQTAYDNLTAANKKTEQQRARAESAEDSIRIQFGIIKLTNRDLRLTIDAKSQSQSRAAAEAAMNLIDEGDSYGARRVALAALDKAYTPEAEAALRRACEKDNAVLKGHLGKVRYCTFSHSGKYIASASEDRTIRIWDVASGKCICTLKGHGATVGSVSFSFDDKFIVSSSDDNTIRVWNAASGNTVRIMNGHKGYIVSATFDPEGKYILSASEDSTVRKWDVSTGQCIDSMKINTGYIKSACYCPDGRRIIVASRDAKVYDADTWQCMDSIMGLSGFDFNSFSSDGGFLVSSQLSKVNVWNGSFKKIASYNCKSLSSRPSTISPDGRFFNTNNGKKINLWMINRDLRLAILKTTLLGSDFNEGVCVMELEGHSSTVNYALFSPDGKRVASVSDDGTVRLWDVTRLSKIVVPKKGDSLDVLGRTKKEKIQTEKKTDEIPLQDLIDQTRQRFKNRPLTPEERRTYYLDN